MNASREGKALPIVAGTGLGVAASLTLGPVLAVTLAYGLAVLTFLVLPLLLLTLGLVVMPTYLLIHILAGTVGTTRPLRRRPLAEAPPSGIVRGQPVPVQARVVEITGTCPAGHRFQAGDTFLFLNGHADPRLCRKAERALYPYIGGVRQGSLPPGTPWVCTGPHHRIAFQLFPEEEPALPRRGMRRH